MALWLSYGDKGERVRDLQRLLNNNPYHSLRRPLRVDGEFGPLTAGAINQTKYFLGYAREEIQPVAGEPLFAILHGKLPLTIEQKARRKARIEKRKQQQQAQSEDTKRRLRALAIIKGELGTLEPGNSNHIKYNTWWGWGAVPYCVIGVSWAWVKAGSKAFVKGARWAGTDVMLEDAKNHRNGM